MANFIINPSTGNRIATAFKDLPPLRKGYVRIVHRTHPENIGSIVENGLRTKTSGGLYYTSDCYMEGEFWDMLANDPRGDLFGRAKIIMDMPIREYNKLTRPVYSGIGKRREYRYYNEKTAQTDYCGTDQLVCPSKYIVGAIEQRCPLFKKCLDLIRAAASKNSEVKVKETDLRMFNLGRPVRKDPYDFLRNKERYVSPYYVDDVPTSKKCLIFDEDGNPTWIEINDDKIVDSYS